MDFRPHAHFTAEDTWLNDPNGLLFHDGRWHLFFQNNPEGPDWGNTSWGHASSTDLVHWDHLPVAIRHEGGEAIFSGSVVVAGERIAAVCTSAYDDGKQAQSLAWSSDGVTFVKDPANPVLDRGSRSFRDPEVFRSDDLRHGEFLSRFADGSDEGSGSAPTCSRSPWTTTRTTSVGCCSSASTAPTGRGWSTASVRSTGPTSTRTHRSASTPVPTSTRRRPGPVRRRGAGS